MPMLHLVMKQQQINKFFLRFLFVFFVHVIIKIGDQSFTGFFDASTRGLIFSAGFITYWLVIWYIAAYFNGKILQKQEVSSKNKKNYIYVLFSFHLIFGLIASFIANFSYRLWDIYFFNNSEIWSSVPVINPELTFSLLTVYMMVFTFDTFYHSNIKQKEDQLKLEKLEKDSTLAQYLNLKSQIEPHFLFNSLSVLSSLIYTNADLASEFVLRLSRILRYVIEKNEFLLVPLKEEIIFVENYIFLIQTRFENEILCEIHLDKKLMNTRFVPPAALQTLVENAIKHNKFTKNKPLIIEINNTEECLVVKNNVQLRNDSTNSTKQGLDNLKARFSHFTETPVEIMQTKYEFSVSLPLLTKEHDERFNI
ncbi:MAG: hypothetical protein GXO86_06080 [Chlorobi bacterium]|nr:hypothetical protein [Chlorobiota bacterium]